MQINDGEYSSRVINDILFALTQAEVRTIIDKAMLNQSASEKTAEVFVDEMMRLLEQFSPMDQTAQQWTSIKMAKLHFNGYRPKFRLPQSAGKQR